MTNGNQILAALSGANERLNLGLSDVRNRALISSGIVFFDGLIVSEECECGCGQSDFSELCRNFLFLHIESLKLEPAKRKPIWIVLNSPGGSVHDGFGFYDLVKNSVDSGLEVNILGMATVASVATVVMQAGTKRFSFPNTQFLIHEVSQSALTDREKVSESRERVEEMERLNGIAMKIISDRAGIDPAELIKLSKKKEFWLDANAARNFGHDGLIDGIITKIPPSF